MIKTIKSFFDANLSKEEENPQDKIHQTNLASAALLVEVMNSDHELDERESAAVLEVLQKTLGVTDEELHELADLAKAQAHQATSLYEFTRLINDNFEYEKKCELIENMWRVAFADEQLDKYEEHLIRRVAELIYVSHSDFIQRKLKVRDS